MIKYYHTKKENAREELSGKHRPGPYRRNYMKAGIAQMDIIWENVEANMEKAENFCREAERQEMELIVFPEMSLTGFSMDVEKTTADWKGQVRFFREMSLRYGMSVIFGYPAPSRENMEGKNGRYYENHLAVVQSGNVLMDYVKIHPFSYGQEGKAFKGGEHIRSVRWNNTVLGGFICYDLRFPEIFQISSARSELIVVIANWPRSRIAQWDCLLRARAIENQCYILGVNRVGEGGGLIYNGQSALYGPDGKKLTPDSEKEELLAGECDWNQVRLLRESFPLRKDRKEDFYRSAVLDLM